MCTFIVVMGLHSLLSRWKRNPTGNACNISGFSSHANRRTPFSDEEIRGMKNYLLKHNPTNYALLFGSEAIVSLSKPQPC